MAILFGHPTGNPNSHNAALAHFEANRLEAFCIPWMPTPAELSILRRIPRLSTWAARLERRSFPALLAAPRIEGPVAEVARLIRRMVSSREDGEREAYKANDWLMRTMRRELTRPSVSAIHSYEDCSLLPFELAKRIGKTCIYDMPIGYYPAWQELEKNLARDYCDWLPKTGLSSRRFVRPEQKRREMELADIVLVPSGFVERTIRQNIDKKCVIARYGVDTKFWCPAERKPSRCLRFIFAGQLSLRKGVHVLIDAWRKAKLPESELLLVGRWDFANKMRQRITGNIRYFPPCSPAELRELYRSANVLVFPSFFEGFGLVLLEAMACGLPFIASESSGAGPDLSETGAGFVIPTGNLDALVEALREVSTHRDDLPKMQELARSKALRCTWEQYRRTVSAAVAPLC